MNIYKYKKYFHDHLESEGVDLNNHFDISNLEKHAEADYAGVIKWSEGNIENATVKHLVVRPFLPYSDLQEAAMAIDLGYCKENTTEINFGIEKEDDLALKQMLGDSYFSTLGLDKETSLVRLLRYDPGTGIPLHRDSYNGFKSHFGEFAKGRKITRYFTAVSPWCWGHFLQVHDNMIHHWNPGYTVEIPEGVFHLSANFGISPKYSLTVTGYIND